jgi:predicted transcriptional regulator
MPPAPLGDRELDVMAVLWDTGSGTVAEVRGRLPVDLAYTTVLTILRNLEAKGFVRHDEEGKAHRYIPLVQRSTAGRGALGVLLRKLFRGSPELLLTQLVEDQSLSSEELRRLKQVLDARLASSGDAAPDEMEEP